MALYWKPYIHSNQCTKTRRANGCFQGRQLSAAATSFRGIRSRLGPATQNNVGPTELPRAANVMGLSRSRHMPQHSNQLHKTTPGQQVHPRAAPARATACGCLLVADHLRQHSQANLNGPFGLNQNPDLFGLALLRYTGTNSTKTRRSNGCL